MELKVLPRRGKAGSRPSEYQFWPLPWGVRCGKEEVLGVIYKQWEYLVILNSKVYTPLV